jgi:hypothetical protein
MKHSKYSKLFKDGEFADGIASEDLSHILNAVMKVYPMIVFSNLTRNKYFLVRDEDFLFNSIPAMGAYDDLIDDNVSNIHKNYQDIFMKCFSRGNLLREYASGKTDVYAELYQKDHTGEYGWVSTHTIRIQDDSEDIIQICFNRPLGGVVKKDYPHF